MKTIGIIIVLTIAPIIFTAGENSNFQPDEKAPLDTGQPSWPFQSRIVINPVIQEMVDLATKTGMLWDPDRMIEAVLAREQLQSTAMPNGVALLHPRRPLANILGEPVLALGVSLQGIPFGGSRSLTNVFFLICSTDDRGHLHTLARLSRMLQEPTLVDKLRDANDSVSAKRVFQEFESQLAE